MTPDDFKSWYQNAPAGARVAYYDGRRADPIDVLWTVHEHYAAGLVLLEQVEHSVAGPMVHYATKLSPRATRFIAEVSASVPAPKMGAYGRYAAGQGDDPDERR